MRLSVTLSHALDALQHTAPNLLARGVGPAGGPSEAAGPGAAIAIGAGEAFPKLKTNYLAEANLLPTCVWVEVDLLDLAEPSKLRTKKVHKLTQPLDFRFSLAIGVAWTCIQHTLLGILRIKHLNRQATSQQVCTVART